VFNTLQFLKGIHDHDSLSPHYREMLNQCNVLLVSHFSSAVAEIFRTSVTEAVRAGRQALLKEDIRVPLRDLHEIGTDLADRIGELFVAHRDISFQDMQSIGRAFREYFGYEPPRDEIVNDILVSQACRHAIVHTAGTIDRKMFGQIRGAKPRTLMLTIRENHKIQFTEPEVRLVSDRMKAFLEALVMNIAPTLMI
jgi:hypothetical protein